MAHANKDKASSLRVLVDDQRCWSLTNTGTKENLSHEVKEEAMHACIIPGVGFFIIFSSEQLVEVWFRSNSRAAVDNKKQPITEHLIVSVTI